MVALGERALILALALTASQQQGAEARPLALQEPGAVGASRAQKPRRGCWGALVAHPAAANYAEGRTRRVVLLVLRGPG